MKRGLMNSSSSSERPEAVGLYLDLLKKVLTDDIYADDRSGWALHVRSGPGPRNLVRTALLSAARRFGYSVVKTSSSVARREGTELPAVAHTQVGLKRLEHLQTCIEQVLRDGVPGDLIGTGIWRGGTCIFMRG